ncbi:hypothetical protein [Porcincola intestinalis]|uniref:Uncharacterized protein n=1 Tax=Porcincola intestinalis TaxID=2606632 RepID=A0A6L5X8Z3_9FIRM|nr:hypothetical protein [Porcincola intestinalis]MCI6238920.1 hypothetical protein [Lachnospiraceae bacterium]MCI6766795.1 hypothetical protein [Lachnospiraceae bacterium]MDD7061020.1 hypothetical protein [Porcincola intestinalis]MDY4205766.1 hypothetical protein [Porcincola intestinalis]MDY5284040.1 hypothetical protein [Porcincola intestinalis]
MIFGTCGQRAPSVGESAPAERRKYIEEHFRCISDCDMCGICAVYHNQDPLLVYRDYIEGTRTFEEITEEYRR